MSDVLIRLILLMMRTWLLETCRQIAYGKELWVKLAIYKKIRFLVSKHKVKVLTAVRSIPAYKNYKLSTPKSMYSWM